jgi:hypothetical protein
LCFDCLPGKYSEANSATECSKCSSGQFQSIPGQTDCLRPESDQVVGTGGSTFIEIAKGWFATEDPNNPSLPCPAGSYGTKPPSHECTSCPQGFTSFKGNLHCVACEKGKMSNENRSSSCTKCNTQLGEYADEDASITCKQCTENQRSTGIKCESLGIDPFLEIPQLTSLVINGTNQKQLFLAWQYGKESAAAATADVDENKKLSVLAFEIETSNKRTFEKVKHYEVLVNNGIGHELNQGRNYTYHIALNNSAYIESTYVRLSASVMNAAQARLLSKQVSTIGWATWNCPQLDTSYLDASSDNPLDWTCRSCPVNAYCEGQTTYNDVKARFGHWRLIGPTKTTFVPCAFPFACLGAPTQHPDHFETPRFQNLSTSNLNEQCNVKEGYLQICDSVHNTTCR